jgi:hypothetical protein
MFKKIATAFVVMVTCAVMIATIIFAQWYSYHCPAWLLHEDGRIVSPGYIGASVILLFAQGAFGWFVCDLIEEIK